MEIDPSWLLLLPVVFALGWVTARYDRGQQRRESRHVSHDVMHAMSALLADDAQQATDALLSAARSDPEATELHRAVGNLYRRRGLIDRAIEVHEAALRHPDLVLRERLLLMADLGRDYQAAGLFDRAEAVLIELLDHADTEALANEARLLLLQIAQITRNWDGALQWAMALRQHGGTFGDAGYEQLMGHFHCEQADLALARGDQQAALAALAQAESFPASGPAQRIGLLRAQMVAGGTKAAHDATGQTACRVCGFRTRQVVWQCPGCHHWDSFEPVK